jgi:ABC-type bacteriocin/lantibiotic exporter with double-glycine peptidase domain
MNPILWATFGLIALIVLVVGIVNVCRMLFFDGDQTIKRLANALMEENKKVLAELAEVKETLNTVHQMLRDVQ